MRFVCLQSLDVSGCALISDTSVLALASSCVHLHTLTTRGCTVATTLAQVRTGPHLRLNRSHSFVDRPPPTAAAACA